MMVKTSNKMVIGSLGPILVILAAAIASCAGQTSPEKAVVIALEFQDFSKNPDYSGTVQIAKGGILTIKLFSNATTGFSWTDPVLTSGSSVLELTGHEYVPPEIPNPGAPGLEVWTYRARDTGNCRIRAEYKRSSDTTPTWTFRLTVEVF